MQALIELSESEQRCFFLVIQESLAIHHRTDFLIWMQGSLQQLLPNEMLLSAWGDFSSGELCFEWLPIQPGLQSCGAELMPTARFVQCMFTNWVDNGYAPLMLQWPHDFDISSMPTQEDRVLRSMHSALVHGLHKGQGRPDMLYILFASAKHFGSNAPRMFQALLPYIDASLRTVSSENGLELAQAIDPSSEVAVQEFLLSQREQEIMRWVRQGKTNQEIGIILDISIFTVKNHLQRIFKKLDVMNRAQAVASLSPTGQIHG